MIWVVACLGAILFFSIANLFDTYFANHLFKSTHALVFYLSILNVLFLPLVLIYEIPSLPSIHMIPYLLLLGFTNVVYLYPWYKALKSGEVSVVSSLFALGKLFVPVLAFLLVHETLGLSQYVGFFIIVIASALLSYEGAKGVRFKFNSSLWWMVLCSFIIAVEVVLYRYVFSSLSWSSGFVWSFVASLVVILPLLFFSTVRKQIRLDYSIFRENIAIIVVEEFATFLGMGMVTLAISLQKVALVETVMSLQPMVILGLGYGWSRFFLKEKKYHLDRSQVTRRVMLFLVMMVGVYFTFG